MNKSRIPLRPQRPATGEEARGRLTLEKLIGTVATLAVLLVLFQGLPFGRLPPADRDLAAALDRNDPEGARAALEAGALVARRDLTGGTYLHTAAYRGQMELADLLVSHGLDADVRDNAGVTPLHLAASSGHWELAAWLIRKGAAVSAATTAFVERCDGNDFPVGFTPLDVARQAGQWPVVELLQGAAGR